MLKLLAVCILLFVSVVFSFKVCPVISKVDETSAMDITQVCACLDKQDKKIICRTNSLELTTFELVKDYMDYLRRSVTYDHNYLITFYLCINVRHNPKQPIPEVNIDAELMSELSFEVITIAYCNVIANDKRDPIKFMFEPDFLRMQTDTLRTLEIEIPSDVQAYDHQLMYNLANAIMSLKKLSHLLIWIDKSLHLHIPENMFAIHSLFDYIVPLSEITFTNFHQDAESERPDQVVNGNQVLSIGSNAFLHLKWLSSITLQNVRIGSIDAFAFSSLYAVSRFLRINFTMCNLEQTVFDKKAFLGLNREAIIHLNDLNLLNPRQPFIPQEDAFVEFLLQNSANKLRLNYKVDCASKTVSDRVKWMLDPKYGFNNKRIELNCTGNIEMSIFRYFKPKTPKVN